MSSTDTFCRAITKDAVNKTISEFHLTAGTHALIYYFNGGLSIVLVLLGGLFAGLTLA
jgi:metal transporter CNNM